VFSNSIIRIIFLSLIISFSFAFYAKGRKPQDPKVSMKVVNVPLSEVLKILELKTNYTFSYLNEELSLNEKVTMDVKDKTLQQILGIISKRFKLTFTRINNIITVKKKESINKKNNPRIFGTHGGTIHDSTTWENPDYNPGGKID
jgi:hypothetical protein